MLDVALLVPIQSRPSIWGDSDMRAFLAPTQLVAVRARDRFVEHLGANVGSEAAPQVGAHRSLTAVSLCTSLERAGLDWHAIDPGWLPLQGWRARLESLRRRRPRLVALSTTFITDGLWVASLCALIRKILPDARLAVGGYYYATDANAFLSLDADILCVGEGEVRIVSITEAIRDGRSLDGIPGLYIRDGSGRLRYTGDAEPLDLDGLPLPDWSLSTRMDPPLDPERETLDYPTETQRGCIFKCEFCTFRTLAAPALGSVKRAVERIRDASSRGPGMISLVDATATYPRERWRRILECLVAEGGSPLPMSLYARAPDIDDEISRLMAQAGVRFVRIGQESGDQRVLNLMRKGTRVDQVGPAVAALGRHGIRAMLFMIYGFPGETEESLAANRRLLRTINDGHEDSPVVRTVRIGLFDHQDFAGIHQRELADGARRFSWNKLEISPRRAWAAALETYLELCRIPHAPYTGFDAGQWLWRFYGHTEAAHYDDAFFRWAKALDRGIGIFVEEELEGKRPDLRELSELRARVLHGLPPALRRQNTFRRALTRAKNRGTWGLIGEWTREPEMGVGPLTRVALALDVARATGSPQQALFAIRKGRYPSLGFVSPPHGIDTRSAAEELIRFGTKTGKRRLPKAI
jgi:anaerobic magnesium-protoporphyrin IX monomethyl ester cyclase